MPVWAWILIGAVLLALFSGGKAKRTPSSHAQPFRVDHPHYLSDDESECSVCGARFPDKVMVCPKCGAVFGTATTDDTEFIEEMEIYDGDEK